ncbi:MAG TPA: glycosyltransferase [Candidatus Microsaccharimonas sp.]|nr:glycosyltransferase [Candidatus Microsaccharimonas sp.]
MKIGIVGPTHPYKGGIAQHTTQMAHQLQAAGHEVEIISWKRQYPFFYPGQQFVADDKPEMPRFPAVKRVLAWNNPLGWARWARYMRQFDRVVFVWWVPTIQGPVYSAMLAAMGKKRPETVLVCHNALQHEPRPGDKQLIRAVFKRVDTVIVHNPEQAKRLKELFNVGARVVKMPLALPLSANTKKSTLDQHLLFFGFVRPYKGVDVLIRAMAQVPEPIHLTIAGEVWGGTAELDALISELQLAERVSIEDAYIPSEELAIKINQADAVVLPYRSGTGSWNVEMSHACGTPVIATNIHALAIHVHEGVDGLLCEPEDPQSLATAIKRFYEPGVAKSLRAGIPEVSIEQDWQAYVKAVAR